MKLFGKKKKNKFDSMTSKEAAMALKSAANCVLQNFSIAITPVEIVILNSIVSYMDTFILKCFKGGKLKHTIWILARLMEVKIILQPSHTKEIKSIVNIISGLESLIISEKVKNEK